MKNKQKEVVLYQYRYLAWNALYYTMEIHGNNKVFIFFIRKKMKKQPIIQ